MADSLWEEWIALQRDTFRLIDQRDYPLALEGLNIFLRMPDDPELRSEVIGLRATILEEKGDLQGAREDYLSARALNNPSSYSRYTIELNIAAVSEKLIAGDDAVLWYTKALETVAGDPLTSGAAAIYGLLRCKAEAGLNPSEEKLCAKVVRQAWELFSLPGEPDMVNLQVTLSALADASSRPLPRTGQKQ